MTSQPEGVFGAGGVEPWSKTAFGTQRSLALIHADGTADEALQVERWFQPADRADQSTLRGLRGPLLDIGCGPARMVALALHAGYDAWGLDIEPAVVQRARDAGLPVLKQDLFAALPREGAWGAVLLLDGNIGIGGDVQALIGRCWTLLRPGGSVIVEVDPDPRRDETTICRVRDHLGGLSGPFPWTQVGADRVLDVAIGFTLTRIWRRGRRRFLRLQRTEE